MKALITESTVVPRSSSANPLVQKGQAVHLCTGGYFIKASSRVQHPFPSWYNAIKTQQDVVIMCILSSYLFC